jgi:hypothetical protein
VFVFCCCDIIPETNNLNKERFPLAHRFGGFHPWLLGAVVEQNIMVGTHGSEAAHLTVARKQKEKDG